MKFCFVLAVAISLSSAATWAESVEEAMTEGDVVCLAATGDGDWTVRDEMIGTRLEKVLAAKTVAVSRYDGTVAMSVVFKTPAEPGLIVFRGCLESGPSDQVMWDDVGLRTLDKNWKKWTTLQHRYADAIEHEITIRFTHSDSSSYSGDSVGNFRMTMPVWYPDYVASKVDTEVIRVDPDWLRDFDVELAACGNSLSKLAQTTGLNGVTYAESYVMGLNPRNPDSKFVANIEMRNGEPVISWRPNLNTNEEVRAYTTYGTTTLKPASWHTPVTSEDRFFKVDVTLKE